MAFLATHIPPLREREFLLPDLLKDERAAGIRTRICECPVPISYSVGGERKGEHPPQRDLTYSRMAGQKRKRLSGMRYFLAFYNLSRCGRAAILFWRLVKTPLKCAHETGMVLVSDKVGDFFDFHFRAGKQTSCIAQPALNQQVADMHTRFLFEQALEMRWG